VEIAAKARFGAARSVFTEAGVGSGRGLETCPSPLRFDTTTTSIVAALKAEPCVRCKGMRIGSAACKPIAQSRSAVHMRMRRRRERLIVTRRN
jgi:hypothetical protein